VAGVDKERAADHRTAKEQAEAEEAERWQALARWWMTLLRALAPTWLACCVVAWFLREYGWMLPLLLMLIVGLPLALILTPVIGRRAVAREARWMGSLPFAVTGYLECLGSDHRENERCIHLAFTFRTAPARGVLHDLLATDGGTWSARRSWATREPGPRAAIKEKHNRKVVRWFHAFVRDQLLPLHAKYPFQAVAVGNDGRGKPTERDGG
jgi:hypothetical protein